MVSAVSIVAVVLLILVVVSKTMDLIIGLLGMIGGVFAYFWLGTPESWITQLRVAFEFGVNPADLKTYSLIIAAVSLVVLIMGLARGNKQQRVSSSKQQENVTPEINKTNEPKAEEAKVNEKQEENKAE